jgi:hypothetical protein
MTPERWHQLKEVFSAARDRRPSERAAFLDAPGAGDAVLRAEIEALLAADDSQTSAFVNPPTAKGVSRLRKALVTRHLPGE